jgi:hypothetical protein
MTGSRNRSARVALALWIVWAVVVWNVVFDHTIEIAGRAYLHAAALAVQSGGPYARIDDWMRPAAATALRTACAAAGIILAVGFTGLRVASRRRSVK